MRESIQRVLGCLLAAGVCVACGGAGEPWVEGEKEAAEGFEFATHGSAVTIPAKGGAATLDVASWNIEWFGDTGNGPSNESLQLSNAKDVISGSDFDVWGLAEIVTQSQFNSLESQLSGYAGFTSRESNVVGGSTYYGSTEQSVAILYKSSLATVTDARIVLTGNDYEFGGRPPMQVKLNVTLNGRSEEIVVIVMHAKCCSDTTSWTRRRDGSLALKSYLDSTFPTQKVWVIGDFNDDVDTSITSGQASPYANFVNDGVRYDFASEALTYAGISSTVSYTDTIDHHLLSNEADATFIASSIEVYRVDSYITNYASTTSDHYPVLSRYDWTSSSGSADVIVNEIGANEPGSGTAGEFIEVVNRGTAAAAIGGFTLSDASSVRHTFPSGTSLAAGQAIVVFAGSAGIPGGTPNAVVASTGTLSLANGGDTVTLKNASNAVVTTFTYRSSLASSDGVSINLSPDGGPSTTFVKHNTLSSLNTSPGRRASGAAW
jgi:endonuclease/exonuclease/phosphatase family metal-dependent hydrolase